MLNSVRYDKSNILGNNPIVFLDLAIGREKGILRVVLSKGYKYLGVKSNEVRFMILLLFSSRKSRNRII